MQCSYCQSGCVWTRSRAQLLECPKRSLLDVFGGSAGSKKSVDRTAVPMVLATMCLLCAYVWANAATVVVVIAIAIAVGAATAVAVANAILFSLLVALQFATVAHDIVTSIQERGGGRSNLCVVAVRYPTFRICRKKFSLLVRKQICTACNVIVCSACLHETCQPRALLELAVLLYSDAAKLRARLTFEALQPSAAAAGGKTDEPGMSRRYIADGCSAVVARERWVSQRWPKSESARVRACELLSAL